MDYDQDDGDQTPNLPAIPPPANPADIGFSLLFVIELAMKQATTKEVCDSYGVSKARFEELVEDPVFISAYANALDLLKREGMSFKFKAQLQCEPLLARSWAMIHDKDVPPSVRADLLKSTVRWAGYEQKVGESGLGGGSNNFQININLG